LAGPAGDDGKRVTCTRSTRPAGHQRPIQRKAAVRAHRHIGLLLEPGDHVDGIAAHAFAFGQSRGSSRVFDITNVGMLLIRVTQGSPTPNSSSAEPSIRTNC